MSRMKPCFHLLGTFLQESKEDLRDKLKKKPWGHFKVRVIVRIILWTILNAIFLKKLIQLINIKQFIEKLSLAFYLKHKVGFVLGKAIVIPLEGNNIDYNFNQMIDFGTKLKLKWDIKTLTNYTCGSRSDSKRSNLNQEGITV